MHKLNRRAALAGLVLTGLAAAGCGGQKPAELTAGQIMQQSSDALKKVQTLHFRLNSANGKMVIGTGLAAQSVEGDVAQPDRLKGSATASFGKVTVDIAFVIIGSHEYITNPVTKRWQQINANSEAPNLLDPQRGAPVLLSQATNLQKLANENVGGADCFHIQGTVPSTLVAGLVGGKGSANTLAGDIWVGAADFLPHQIRLNGPVSADEPPEIQRTLELSNFGETITIDPPM
jgi:LppX_LprAFG lipoprotein